ncbi:MAG: choice-of-anchor tandem repeat GloVer-containing protein [Terriglobales bacterium]
MNMCAKQIRFFALLALILAMGVAIGVAQTYTPLYTYPETDRNNTGILPAGMMSQGRDGLLYSTDAYNGANNAGTLFKMSTAGLPTTIYSFCPQAGCKDGAYPLGGATLGFDGNLYGTTNGGGASGAGTVFSVTPGGVLTKLHDFANGTDDSVPDFPVLQGQDGSVYGVSIGQYNGQDGAFYKITPSGNFTAPFDFGYNNGALPNLPTQGTDGNFYGTTILGGQPACSGYQGGCGVVYKLTSAGKQAVLWDFKGFFSNDGALPEGALVQGNDNNFYGVTREGGNSANCGGGCGTVFKITPSGTLTVLYNFTGRPDGAYPDTGLTLGTDGNFYGVTSLGGKANDGALFQITPAGAETVLYNFCSANSCADGFNPETPMVQHTNGKFYGNTSGNSLGGGVFFSLDMGLKPFAGLVTWIGKVGKTAEILGQGFTGTTKVSFNGTPAQFKVVSDTYLAASVPAGATTGFVAVTTPGGVLKSNRKFLVTPQLLSFSPDHGAVGTVVTITGNSLTQTQGVGFGDHVPAKFTVNSDTSVTATVPAGAKTGRVGVKTPGGLGISSGTFTVTP